MNLINLCVWRTLGCVNFSAQNHLAKMLVPIIMNNSHTFSWSAGWSVPSSNHDPQVNIRVPTEACVPTYFRLGEADTEASPPEGNLLLNWVIPLNAASKLHFCFWGGFFSPLPHLQCWCVDGLPLIASLRPWLNGNDVSPRPHGAIRCIPNGHAERTREPWIKKHQWVGGRETLHNTRHYKDWILLNAATQMSFVTAVNLNVTVQIILEIIVAHILNADYYVHLHNFTGVR